MPKLAALPDANFRRRATLPNIRLIHVWLGSVGSALLAVVLVLAVVGHVGQRNGWFSPRSTVVVTTPAPQPAPASTPIAMDGTPSAPRASHTGEAGSAHKHSAAHADTAATPLTKDDIVGVVKQNAQTLGPCLDAVRNKDKLPAGPAVLLVDFTILPTGAVKAAELKGPDWAVKSSLAHCFAAKIKTWKFPSSVAGAPVSNLPLPVTF